MLCVLAKEAWKARGNATMHQSCHFDWIRYQIIKEILILRNTKRRRTFENVRTHVCFGEVRKG